MNDFLDQFEIPVEDSVINSEKFATKTKKPQHRQKFSVVENQILNNLVLKYGLNNWETISKNMINRTPKQCRDHYLNYIMPCKNSSPWSAEEDQLLLIKYQELGPKWTRMAQFFNGRSPNSIKNRWNYYLSKRMAFSAMTSTTPNRSKINNQKLFTDQFNSSNYQNTKRVDNEIPAPNVRFHHCATPTFCQEISDSFHLFEEAFGNGSFESVLTDIYGDVYPSDDFTIL